MYKKQHQHMINICLDWTDPIPIHDQCFSWLNRSSVSLVQHSSQEVYSFGYSLCSRVLFGPLVHQTRNHNQCVFRMWMMSKSTRKLLSVSFQIMLYQPNKCWLMSWVIFSATKSSFLVSPFIKCWLSPSAVSLIFENKISDGIVVTFLHWYEQELNWFH